MEVKICTCKYCKAKKKRMSTKLRQRLKRQTSKARRRKSHKVLNIYYA